MAGTSTYIKATGYYPWGPAQHLDLGTTGVQHIFSYYDEATGRLAGTWTANGTGDPSTWTTQLDTAYDYDPAGNTSNKWTTEANGTLYARMLPLRRAAADEVPDGVGGRLDDEVVRQRGGRSARRARPVCGCAASAATGGISQLALTGQVGSTPRHRALRRPAHQGHNMGAGPGSDHRYGRQPSAATGRTRRPRCGRWTRSAVGSSRRSARRSTYAHGLDATTWLP